MKEILLKKIEEGKEAREQYLKYCSIAKVLPNCEVKWFSFENGEIIWALYENKHHIIDSREI
jgi:hypothetical protein